MNTDYTTFEMGMAFGTFLERETLKEVSGYDTEQIMELIVHDWAHEYEEKGPNITPSDFLIRKLEECGLVDDLESDLYLSWEEV